jgi:hypothetical protein
MHVRMHAYRGAQPKMPPGMDDAFELNLLPRWGATIGAGANDSGQTAGGDIRSVAGFRPFPSQGVLITNAQIESLRDAEGV